MKIDDNYPSTLPELAKRYKVTTNTLYIWLKPIRQELIDMYPFPKERLRTLLPKQVKCIIEFLG
jgi:transposase